MCVKVWCENWKMDRSSFLLKNFCIINFALYILVSYTSNAFFFLVLVIETILTNKFLSIHLYLPPLFFMVLLVGSFSRPLSHSLSNINMVFQWVLFNECSDYRPYSPPIVSWLSQPSFFYFICDIWSLKQFIEFFIMLFTLFFHVSVDTRTIDFP